MTKIWPKEIPEILCKEKAFERKDRLMPLEKDQEARSGSRLHQKRSTSIYYYPFFSVVISFVFTSTRAMYAYLYTPEDDWPVFNGVEKGTYVYGEKLHEARHTTRAAKFLQCLI